MSIEGLKKQVVPYNYLETLWAGKCLNAKRKTFQQQADLQKMKMDLGF